jgi:triacylglycerol lipase
MSTRDPPMLGPADAQALPTWRAAYSDRTAALMAAFSELAYLAPGDAALAASLTSGGFSAPQMFATGGLQAFLTVNSSEFAVLSFQGTANPSDWGVNLNALRQPLPHFPDVGVHRGFWAAWQLLASAIHAAVDQLPPNLGLYITGHSLGGALAQIASAELERDTLAACYTFGSPRVATLAFDACVKCPHYRLINTWDLVPGVPLPMIWWGYRHTGDARLLKGAAPQQILRRGRVVVTEVAVDLWSALSWLVIRKLAVVDDHMIWNYRGKLERIASARN